MDPSILTDRRVPAPMRARLQSMALDLELAWHRGVRPLQRTPAGKRMRAGFERVASVAEAAEKYRRPAESEADSEEPEHPQGIPWDSIAIGLGAVILIGGIALLLL